MTVAYIAEICKRMSLYFLGVNSHGTLRNLKVLAVRFLKRMWLNSSTPSKLESQTIGDFFFLHKVDLEKWTYQETSWPQYGHMKVCRGNSLVISDCSFFMSSLCPSKSAILFNVIARILKAILLMRTFRNSLS